MVRKSVQIHAPEITLANAVGFWRVGCLLKIELKLGIEFFGELWPCDTLVVIHDARDVRGDLLVEFQTHQPRRFFI
jgi:hypothetical protein